MGISKTIIWGVFPLFFQIVNKNMEIEGKSGLEVSILIRLVWKSLYEY